MHYSLTWNLWEFSQISHTNVSTQHIASTHARTNDGCLLMEPHRIPFPLVFYSIQKTSNYFAAAEFPRIRLHNGVQPAATT